MPAVRALTAGRPTRRLVTNPPARRPMVVCPATAADLPAMARLQLASLPHGLFPRLGPGFVRRWHATYLDSPYGVALVFRSPGEPVVGYLLGSTDQVAHMDHVLQVHRRGLAVRGGVALLARPGTAAQFLRTRAWRYARRLLSPRPPARPQTEPGEGGPEAPVRTAVVTAVAVNPSSRGTGAGGALVQAFLVAAAAADASCARLVTKAGPTGASHFYQRLGWSVTGTHADRDGDLVRAFCYDLVRTAHPGTDARTPSSAHARSNAPSARDSEAV